MSMRKHIVLVKHDERKNSVRYSVKETPGTMFYIPRAWLLRSDGREAVPQQIKMTLYVD